MSNSAVVLNHLRIPFRGTARSPKCVVLLHGLFGNKLNNRPIATRLVAALQRDAHLLDLRNHGGSPRCSPHTYQAMAADVARYLRDQRLDDTVVVGHSMGGKVAMDLVLRGTHGVAMGVCIENAPVATLPNANFLRYTRELRKICQTQEIITPDQLALRLKTLEPHTATRQFLRSLLSRGKDGSYSCKIPLDILEDALVKGHISEWTDPRPAPLTSSTSSDVYNCAAPGPVNTPMLFIRGTASGYLADERAAAIPHYFSNFDLRDVPGAAHFVNAERPADCAALIAHFVRGHEDT